MIEYFVIDAFGHCVDNDYFCRVAGLQQNAQVLDPEIPNLHHLIVAYYIAENAAELS
jgi:hypothetical protein